MIKDPALGKNKAERAWGNDVDAPGVRTQKSNKAESDRRAKNGRATEFLGARNVNERMVPIQPGPKVTYGRYQTSEAAQDVLNRQLRTYNR
jgi:hypothetical protein